MSSDSVSWPQAILHVDMDAFYVNVHLLSHPEDAGLPLAIGGRPDQRGVVASASYEARAFGVCSAMPMAKALRLCPSLKVVGADWPEIRRCSRLVMDILRPYGTLEQISVDEAYIDLAELVQPQHRALAIPTIIKSATSLPASVGLATSKLVAKVASDFDKPEGVTIVEPGTEAAFLAPLPVRVIWGIGPRTAERLAQIGIRTCGELAAVDLDRLRRQFGRESESLIRRANGIDGRHVRAERGPPKSISQEWTFSRDTRDLAELQDHMQSMSAHLAEQLTRRQLVAQTVRVKFRWADFTTFTRQRSLELPTADAERIYQMANLLWLENWTPDTAVRLIGVGVSSLAEGREQQLGFDF